MCVCVVSLEFSRVHGLRRYGFGAFDLESPAIWSLEFIMEILDLELRVCGV